MKSIQTKFIMLILGSTLLSSCIIGGAGILNAKLAVDADSAKIMNIMCSDKAQEINGLLSRIEQSVNTLSVYALSQIDNFDKLKMDSEYLKNYTKKLEAVALNAARNTDGAMAVYIRFNPEFAPPTSGLFWSKTTLNGSFRRLTPTDLLRFSSLDIEHVGWYYIPIKNGKPTWMSPYLNKNINIEMISFVAPLYHNNEVVGVLGMDIDFGIIAEIAKNMLVYQSGYAFLADKHGNVIYHKDYAIGTAITNIDESLRPLAAEMQNVTSGSSLFSYSWQGHDKKMAFRTLSNGMVFAATSLLSDIDSAKNSLIKQVVSALLLIALISVVLTVLVTRRLIRPLKELNVAAKKIAAGDLSISLKNNSKDEVGTLTESFQQTVEHLQKYINYINGLAYKDSLTGVKNKTAYQDAVTKIEKEMKIGEPVFGVIMFDLNDLKKVNDLYGHDFGDLLITNACRLICKSFQHSPVYRIGGDEFVVIIENGDYHKSPELIARLQADVEEYNKFAKEYAKISIAYGMASYDRDTDLVFANIFKRADDAMYHNKVEMKAKINK